MIVCHCRGLTDRDVRQAVRDGARTVRQVGRAWDRRTCGGCAPAIAELIERESAQGTLLTVTTFAAAS